MILHTVRCTKCKYDHTFREESLTRANDYECETCGQRMTEVYNGAVTEPPMDERTVVLVIEMAEEILHRNWQRIKPR